MVTRTIALPKAKYQGYIWFSDSTKPEIIDKEFSLDISSETNPFIAEAYLMDEDKQISYSIKFVDGNYLFNPFRIDENDLHNFKVYEGKRMNGIRLRFTQRWKEVKDELCCGMTTRIPAEMVFVGFDNN